MFLNKSLCWFCNERDHGKVPMNDVGRTIKNVTFRKVKSGQIVVHTLKEFSDAAMKFVLSNIIVYLPKQLSLKVSIRHYPASKHFQSTNLFDRSMTGEIAVQNFPKTAVDQEAFHTQWYKKTSNVVCGHKKSNKNNSECSTCGEWYTEDGSKW